MINDYYLGYRLPKGTEHQWAIRDEMIEFAIKNGYLVDFSAADQCWIIEEMPEKSEKQKLQEEEKGLKSYLASTDYITAKMTECMATEGDIKALVAEYAEVIYQRTQARSRINIIEETLNAD